MNGSSASGSTARVSSDCSCGRVDVRIAMILEDPEVAIEADVDARRLDHVSRKGLQPDPPGGDFSLDVAIREQHAATLSGQPRRILSQWSPIETIESSVT